MVEMAPRNFIKISKDRINAQLFEWSCKRATFMKLRQSTSKFVKGSRRPTAVKKMSYTKRKLRDESSEALLT